MRSHEYQSDSRRGGERHENIRDVVEMWSQGHPFLKVEGEVENQWQAY